MCKRGPIPRKWLGPHSFADYSIADSRLSFSPYNSSAQLVLHIVKQVSNACNSNTRDFQIYRRIGGLERILTSKEDYSNEVRASSGEKAK